MSETTAEAIFDDDYNQDVWFGDDDSSSDAIADDCCASQQQRQQQHGIHASTGICGLASGGSGPPAVVRPDLGQQDDVTHVAGRDETDTPSAALAQGRRPPGQPAFAVDDLASLGEQASAGDEPAAVPVPPGAPGPDGLGPDTSRTDGGGGAVVPGAGHGSQGRVASALAGSAGDGRRGLKGGGTVKPQERSRQSVGGDARYGAADGGVGDEATSSWSADERDVLPLARRQKELREEDHEDDEPLEERRRRLQGLQRGGAGQQQQRMRRKETARKVAYCIPGGSTAAVSPAERAAAPSAAKAGKAASPFAQGQTQNRKAQARGPAALQAPPPSPHVGAACTLPHRGSGSVLRAAGSGDIAAPAPRAKRQRLDEPAEGPAGVAKGAGGAAVGPTRPSHAAGAAVCGSADGVAESDLEESESEPEVDLKNLRPLPERGWGHADAAAELRIRQLAQEVGLDRASDGAYTLDWDAGKDKWIVRPLAKQYQQPLLKRAIKVRVRVEVVTDPCHPVYNNPAVQRCTQKKQRMLLYNEKLPKGTLLALYFGTVKTQMAHDEYVLADETRRRQLKDAYTHDFHFTEHFEKTSERLLVVGDNTTCIMTYANEIKFWAPCQDLWHDNPRLLEHSRQSGCNCHLYSKRAENADSIQGIIKWKDEGGAVRYMPYMLYKTCKAVDKDTEVLLHWDRDGAFFQAMMEAASTNAWYKGLHRRLVSLRDERDAAREELLDARAAAGVLSRQLSLRDEAARKMKAEVEALNKWAAQLEKAAAEDCTAGPSAQPLPAELSYPQLLGELHSLRQEVALSRAVEQAACEAQEQARTARMRCCDTDKMLERERAWRQEAEQQLDVARATANVCRVERDHARRELERLQHELNLRAAEGKAATAGRGDGGGEAAAGGGANAGAGQEGDRETPEAEADDGAADEGPSYSGFGDPLTVMDIEYMGPTTFSGGRDPLGLDVEARDQGREGGSDPEPQSGPGKQLEEEPGRGDVGSGDAGPRVSGSSGGGGGNEGSGAALAAAGSGTAQPGTGVSGQGLPGAGAGGSGPMEAAASRSAEKLGVMGSGQGQPGSGAGGSGLPGAGAGRQGQQQIGPRDGPSFQRREDLIDLSLSSDEEDEGPNVVEEEEDDEEGLVDDAEMADGDEEEEEDEDGAVRVEYGT